MTLECLVPIQFAGRDCTGEMANVEIIAWEIDKIYSKIEFHYERKNCSIMLLQFAVRFDMVLCIIQFLSSYTFRNVCIIV